MHLMRIIAGHARGRPLKVPRGKSTRPTTDRVREALFSMIAADLPADVSVLDLFAGSGALGLEALSRGAGFAVFVEPDRLALSCLRGNIRAAGLAADARVLPCAAERALTRLQQEGQRFAVAFLDPPYASDLLASSLASLFRRNLMRPEALLVCEHSSRVAPPTLPLGWQIVASRPFGEVCLTLIRTSTTEQEPS